MTKKNKNDQPILKRDAVPGWWFLGMLGGAGILWAVWKNTGCTGTRTGHNKLDCSHARAFDYLDAWPVLVLLGLWLVLLLLLLSRPSTRPDFARSIALFVVVWVLGLGVGLSLPFVVGHASDLADRPVLIGLVSWAAIVSYLARGLLPKVSR